MRVLGEVPGCSHLTVALKTIELLLSRVVQFPSLFFVIVHNHIITLTTIITSPRAIWSLLQSDALAVERPLASRARK